MKNSIQANIDILRHILRYCDNIEQLILRFGKDIETFKNDLAYRDAVSMNILQIGELTGRLSEEYRSATKDRLPWAAMKSMRNFFAHNYGNMDLSVIWATAVNNIPEVKKFCEEQIANHDLLQSDALDFEDDEDLEI